MVEKLSLKRKALKDMEAIYVVSPTEVSVNKIIEDFEPNKRLYQACHLFFITSQFFSTQFFVLPLVPRSTHVVFCKCMLLVTNSSGG